MRRILSAFTLGFGSMLQWAAGLVGGLWDPDGVGGHHDPNGSDVGNQHDPNG